MTNTDLRGVLRRGADTTRAQLTGAKTDQNTQEG